MPRLRIAVIAPANSIHTIRWVNGLSAYADIDLFSLADHPNKSEMIDPSVRLTYLPSRGKLGYLLAARALRRLAKGFAVYNVHYASGYGTLARLAGIKPYVLNFWGTDIFEFPNKSPIHRRLIQGNAKHAAHVVSTSEVMKQEILKICPGLSVSVVPFGVDLSRFDYQSHQITEGRLRLGTCKILSPPYAIDDMIKAVSLLKQLLKDSQLELSLSIYGDGPSRSELADLIHQLELDEIVTLHGWISHDSIPDVLQRMDIFLLSSLQESFGVSAIEAQAAGVPVIATATAGFQEVIQNGRTGRIVAVADPPAMAQAILDLVKDPASYQRYRLAGRESVEVHYDWDKNVKQQYELLERVAQANKV
ncbi:MAG TPA: glycosyltransferase family 4 protein [Tissierellia bacterium]|nr:glycosyltransferase family 4 protein [Tissierellia bacterium]